MRELAVGVSIMMPLLLVTAPATGQDRPIVAVFDVEVKGAKMGAGTLDRLTDYLGTLIARRGYKVVPRSQLKDRLREQKKDSYKQCYDQSCQIDLGRELAADKSLAAQVLKLGKECKVTLTLFDLKQSASEGAGAASGRCDEDGIVKALVEAVADLLGASNETAPAKPAPAVEPKVLPVQEAPPNAATLPAEKAGLTWVKSVPAGIEFTKSEVTVAQYRACVKAGKCEEPTQFLGRPENDAKQCNWGYPDRDNHPVNCVDWNQATAFCKWVGGRLPTEEEWYAEASSKGTRQYPWGDQAATCDYMVMDQGGPGCGRGSTWHRVFQGERQ